MSKFSHALFSRVRRLPVFYAVAYSTTPVPLLEDPSCHQNHHSVASGLHPGCDALVDWNPHLPFLRHCNAHLRQVAVHKVHSFRVALVV